VFLFVLLVSSNIQASYVLLPMDESTQTNHLKAYGITYWSLQKQQKVKWLLNYRGGSFLFADTPDLQKECKIRGVSFEVLSDNEAEGILKEISSPSVNMEAVVLENSL